MSFYWLTIFFFGETLYILNTFSLFTLFFIAYLFIKTINHVYQTNIQTCSQQPKIVSKKLPILDQIDEQNLWFSKGRYLLQHPIQS